MVIPIFLVLFNNVSFFINKDYISIPSTSIFVIQHVLSSLREMLLYIAAWEFIYCQSPLNIKGIVFGIFYAIQGFYQLMEILFLVTAFSFNWTSTIISCRSVSYLVHIAIGIISFVPYVYVARTYRYRKRDDICNFYQFAENYYSKI